MTAIFDGAQRTRLDPITLAAFKDSGWYQVNHSAAEELLWGHGEKYGSITEGTHDRSQLGGSERRWKKYLLLRCNGGCKNS